ncbi:MAG: 16S rRNA (cytosine(967)-C(5))-methyltransferase RsmB [Halioglobus sp.]
MALDARAAAARIVGQVINGKSLNQAMPVLLEKVTDRDRGLVQQLCYGTLRQYPRLKGVLDQLLDKPLRKKDSDVTALLLVGLYQLDGMRVPDHAAVAATVDATKSLGKPWAKGLANALLRRYLREREDLNSALDEATSNAHPQWLYGKIHKQWPDDATSIIEANNGQPPMSLRVNTRRVNREDYLERLVIAGIPARASTLSPQGICLQQAVDVSDLPGFADGDLSVQDEAAQLAGILLAARPGERILDACAAPGGKSCHVLELQPDLESLTAADIDEQRLLKVSENLQRLGLEASLQTMDATTPAPPEAGEGFDRILVDAPCSASGVIRRHPDVKTLRRPEDIGQLADQQLRILQGLWPRLKPGGTMLYATCSILREENSQVIAKFLALQTDASHRVPEGSWGQATDFGRQLLPSPDGADGLFYSILTKAG